jgi:hypothetical protein
MKKKGFTAGLKECKPLNSLKIQKQKSHCFHLFFPAWTNMKITRELDERARIDEIRFQKAGRSPLVKTYKYDPTKPRSPVNAPSNAVQAKKREN